MIKFIRNLLWPQQTTQSSGIPEFILNQEDFDEVYHKMTPKATPHDIMDSDLWTRYCSLTGISRLAVANGHMDGNEPVELPTELVDDYMSRRKLRAENRNKVK